MTTRRALLKSGLAFATSGMVGLFGGLIPSAARASAVRFDISTENTEYHVQTKVLREFANRLKAELGDILDPVLSHSAQLYRGANELEAVSAGRIQMAATGIWHLARTERNFGLFLLPMFYGRDRAVNYSLRDGEIGQEIAQRLEARTRVHVLGRWIDLGDASLFLNNRNIQSADDLKGLRIRVAGGIANELRQRALGASAVTISWPEFPDALAAGLVDGTLTTPATIVSANLWEKGIRFAFMDRQYFAQYVPMITGTFWKRLGEDRQAVMATIWDDLVDEARTWAAEAQAEALAELEKHGITIVDPGWEALANTRNELMAHQPELVSSLGLDPTLVERAMRALER